MGNEIKADLQRSTSVDSNTEAPLGGAGARSRTGTPSITGACATPCRLPRRPCPKATAKPARKPRAKAADKADAVAAVAVTAESRSVLLPRQRRPAKCSCSTCQAARQQDGRRQAGSRRDSPRRRSRRRRKRKMRQAVISGTSRSR